MNIINRLFVSILSILSITSLLCFSDYRTSEAEAVQNKEECISLLQITKSVDRSYVNLCNSKCNIVSKTKAVKKSETKIQTTQSASNENYFPTSVYTAANESICSWNISGFTPFAYEGRNGITMNPSYQYTWASGNYVDSATGIVRNTYGDYMCAMGTYFGYCGDRFRITLDNGNVFTVQIGDSKGDVEYHGWGSGGKCYVEFIVDYNASYSVAVAAMNAGSYHVLSPFNGNIILIEKL